MKRILVSPLDWGLGHCTRIIPLVQDLLAKDNEVILAACGPGVEILKAHFPNLLLLDDIPSYRITYPDHGFFTMHFLLRSPSFMRAVSSEHQWLNAVVDRYSIDEVYSDNRYGLYHKKIKCKLITHQLNIPAPWFLVPFVRMMASHYFEKFDQIFVPDYNHGMNLSGALSHGKYESGRVKFIGPLSRYQKELAIDSSEKYAYECVAVISGPEPARSLFEELLLNELQKTGLKSLLIQGKPDEKKDLMVGNVRVMNHLEDIELMKTLQNSGLIICRSGYSTIMDLHALDLRAMLVPTPGQAEQIYLAEYHHTADRHLRVRQNELNAEKIIQVKKRINFATWSTRKQM